MSDILLEGRGIVKSFGRGLGGRKQRVLDGVDLRLRRGESLGLMGPSGCGNSTLARILLRLLEPDGGQVLFDGEDITRRRGKGLRPFRRRVQLISQRPETFFDPRVLLGRSLVEPLGFFGLRAERGEVARRLEQVKLTEGLLERYPHQVSGGEIQRLSLCRALLLGPEVLVLDEATSMLDASVQAQILGILRELREREGISCLLITHDRQLAEYFCDNIQTL